MRIITKQKTKHQILFSVLFLLLPFIGITQETIIEGSTNLSTNLPAEDSLAMIILKNKGKMTVEEYERMKKAHLINERKEVPIKEEE